MTWTQGQPFRENQSPYIESDTVSNTRARYSSNHDRRNDRNYNQRNVQSNRTPRETSAPAATFTQEGLEAFSKVFATAMEVAIASSLPRLLDMAIDAKMDELLTRLRSEIHQTTQDVIANTLASELKKISEMKEPSRVLDGQKTVPRTRSLRRLESDLNEVVSTLKSAQHPLRTSELVKLASGVNWGSNPSAKMSKLMGQSGGTIERIGKGIFRYQAN